MAVGSAVVRECTCQPVRIRRRPRRPRRPALNQDRTKELSASAPRRGPAPYRERHADVDHYRDGADHRQFETARDAAVESDDRDSGDEAKRDEQHHEPEHSLPKCIR